VGVLAEDLDDVAKVPCAGRRGERVADGCIGGEAKKLINRLPRIDHCLAKQGAHTQDVRTRESARHAGVEAEVRTFSRLRALGVHRGSVLD